MKTLISTERPLQITAEALRHYCEKKKSLSSLEDQPGLEAKDKFLLFRTDCTIQTVEVSHANYNYSTEYFQLVLVDEDSGFVCFMHSKDYGKDVFLVKTI